MTYRTIRASLLLAVALAAPWVCAADDAAPKADGEPEAAKVRLEFMMGALSQYAVAVRYEDQTRPARMRPEPALRWSNTVSDTRDGIVEVWTCGGRPDVVAQFSGPRAWIYEFGSTSLHPLEMQRNGHTVWAPRAAGVELKPVPKAPAPAATAAQRLIQMRAIADRFEVIDDFHPVYGQPKIERTKLRRLTKPLYRYTASGDLIDGALFGLVIATDPEALLMIEAYETPSGREWRYALARMTVYGLTAKLDGVEVWQAPEKLAGQWAFDDAYFVGPFR